MMSTDGSKWITPNDLSRSLTASMLGDVVRALRPIPKAGCARLLDIGCGFGGLAKFIAEELRAGEVHGVDVDGEALREA
jgi:methylase of polypeptide subunit release factors